MTFFFVFSGMLLLGLFYGRRRCPHRMPILVPAAGGLVLLCGLLLWITTPRNPEPYDLRWEESVGFVLGREMAGDGIQGGSVAVLTHSTGSGARDLSSLQVESLTRGLNSPSLNVLLIDANELVPEGTVWQGDEVDPERLLERMSRISGLRAVVSFIGMPGSLIYARSPPLPPTYVYGPVSAPEGDLGAGPGVNPGLRAVVRMLPDARFSATPKEKTPEAIFRERYEIVRPDAFSL